MEKPPRGQVKESPLTSKALVSLGEGINALQEKAEKLRSRIERVFTDLDANDMELSSSVPTEGSSTFVEKYKSLKDKANELLVELISLYGLKINDQNNPDYQKIILPLYVALDSYEDNAIKHGYVSDPNEGLVLQ